MNRIMKILISIMVIACVLMTLASCAKSDADSSPKATSPEIETSAPAVSTPDPTEETSAKDEVETTEPTTTPTEDTTDETQAAELALATRNTVLLDENGVKVTALDFGAQTSETYVTIDVQVENNNTHDVNIMLNSLTVNGYLISGKLDSFTTKAGANQIVPLTISKRDIEFAEIDEIREIVISLYAKDNEFKSFISPVEPVSIKTTKFDTPSKELDTSGVQVYNDNDILIVVKEELSSDNRYMFAKLLIKNSSTSRISVSCDKLFVNGQELANHNCIRYGKVSAGIVSYNSMDIEKSELEKLGIQEIETIEMTLKVLSEDFTLIAGDLTVQVNYK